MNTPERIKQLLKDAGVADRKVRRTLADLCGITPQAVAQWFDGSTRRISPDYLAKIAEEYDADLDWLVTGKGVPFRLELGKMRESEPDYHDDGLSEIIEQFPSLPRSGKYAVLAVLHRELEKANNGKQ